MGKVPRHVAPHGPDRGPSRRPRTPPLHMAMLHMAMLLSCMRLGRGLHALGSTFQSPKPHSLARGCCGAASLLRAHVGTNEPRSRSRAQVPLLGGLLRSWPSSSIGSVTSPPKVRNCSPVLAFILRGCLWTVYTHSDAMRARLSFELRKSCATFGGFSTSFVARNDQVRKSPRNGAQVRALERVESAPTNRAHGPRSPLVAQVTHSCHHGHGASPPRAARWRLQHAYA